MPEQVRPEAKATWWRRPKNKWLRRAMFQIHLWSGIGVGLYVLAISVSGSAIVFRNEVHEWADAGPLHVEVVGEPLSSDDFKAAVARQYPDNPVSFVFPARDPDIATEVWMSDGDDRIQHLFDPYTGKDLGPSVPYAIQWMRWFNDLHTELLAGEEGMFWNGVGSILLTVLCITGAVIWWPGIASWKRNLWVDPRAGWKRINWDLHTAIGFWSFALVFMWGVTGVYLIWPLPVQKAVNEISPLIQYRIETFEDEEFPADFEEEPDEPQQETPIAEPGNEGARIVALPGNVLAQAELSGSVDFGAPPSQDAQLPENPAAEDAPRPEFRGFGEVEADEAEEAGQVAAPPGGFGKGGFGKGKGRPQIRRSAGDIFLRWFYYLHFGNFMGWKVKALWVVLGLIPAGLFVTGVIMWWNRVIGPKFMRRRTESV